MQQERTITSGLGRETRGLGEHGLLWTGASQTSLRGERTEPSSKAEASETLHRGRKVAASLGTPAKRMTHSPGDQNSEHPQKSRQLPRLGPFIPS